MTGNYQGTATFGSGEPNETQLPSSATGGDSMFIAKYDSDGTLAWAKRATSTADNSEVSASGLTDRGTFM